VLNRYRYDVVKGIFSETLFSYILRTTSVDIDIMESVPTMHQGGGEATTGAISSREDRNGNNVQCISNTTDGFKNASPSQFHQSSYGGSRGNRSGTDIKVVHTNICIGG
jgi:hypothetical protein